MAAPANTGPVRLSVVLPAFNEEENIEPLIDELVQHLGALHHPFEILLVDDASTDGGLEVARRVARREPRLRILELTQHCGQSAAFDAGFRAARGEWVVTMDADLQNDPADIGRLLEASPGWDAVVGWRRVRYDSWLKRISSRISNAIRNWVSGDSIIDTGCSLKLIRRETLGTLKMYNGMHRFLPTLLRFEGWRVREIDVNHRPRLRGRSKYNVRNRALRAFVDLLAVRWMRARRLCYRLRHHEN
ncbi:MAG: glycosyltransferase family 2 protein [Acidobacteriota bacterium]